MTHHLTEISDHRGAECVDLMVPVCDGPVAAESCFHMVTESCFHVAAKSCFHVAAKSCFHVAAKSCFHVAGK